MSSYSSETTSHTAQTIEFADEKSRIAWETAQAIKKLPIASSPEGPHLEAQPISFDNEHAVRGQYAILLAGTVIATGRDGVFLVPKRSLTILDQLGIPYNVVTM